MPTHEEVAQALGFPVDEVLVLQTASTRLLVAVVAGQVDLNDLARQELKSRGMDNQGRWVGFS